MRRLLAFALHATATAVMAWGWFSLQQVTGLGVWVKTQKGGYFQFLTNQGLLVAWSCMALSLLRDVFPSTMIVRHAKRAVLMIALPLSFVVSTIYWSLLLFLPHLILPPVNAGQSAPGATPNPIVLPLTTDLALHVAPLLTLSIDFFAFESKYSKTHVDKVAPAVVVVFSVWYASFVEYCASFNGSFPYPFLTHSPFMGRVLIYTITAGIALGCFRTLNGLHA